MPLEWVPDPDPRIIRFRATAPPPSLEEIEAALREWAAGEHSRWEGLVLNDTTAFPAPTAEYMREIVPPFAAMAVRAGIRRYAILTGEITMFGMGRMASFLADPILEMEAFDNEAKARQWLLRK